jgi:LmbE family N-acetylglucosaminyl deacetylase
VKRSILLVFAHPDDESFGLSGTILKYTRRGIPVDLICATKGERGLRLDVPADVDTGTAREAELRCAAAILGIRDIYFLGYIDADVNKAPIDEIANKVLGIMQKVRPAVVITFGPDGVSRHPDHIALGKAATKAYKKLAEGDGHPPKLYYVTLPASLVPNADELGIVTRPDNEVTTTIDITGFLDLKIQALSCHRSQQDAREFVEMLRQDKTAVFTSKEFLYLANPSAQVKETDLFQ